MALSFEDTGTIKKTGFGEKEPYWDAAIQWFQFPDDNTPHAYRFVAKPTLFSQHWIQSKKKDGSYGKPFTALCQNFDSEKGVYFENGCTICEFMSMAYKTVEGEYYVDPKDGKKKQVGLPDNLKKLGRRITMAQNAIVRELQEQGPPANGKGWSFIRPLQITQGFADTLVTKRDAFNKGPEKGPDGKPIVYEFNHMQRGRDLLITYNKSSVDKNKIYSLDLGEKTSLTPAELEHAPFLVDFATHIKYPKQEELRSALERFGYNEALATMTSRSNLKSILPPAEKQQPTQPAYDPNDDIGDESNFQNAPQKPQATTQPAAQPVSSAAAQPQAAQAAAAVASLDPAAASPVQHHEPVQQTAPAQPVAPVQAQVQPQAAAAAAPAAAQPAAGATIQEKLLGFATEFNRPLVENQGSFPEMRVFQTGMAVPGCFPNYTDKHEIQVCKKCPVRFDCMQADPSV